MVAVEDVNGNVFGRCAIETVVRGSRDSPFSLLVLMLGWCDCAGGYASTSWRTDAEFDGNFYR